MKISVRHSIIVFLSLAVCVASGCSGVSQKQSQTPSNAGTGNGSTVRSAGEPNNVSMLNTTQGAPNSKEGVVNIVGFDGKFYVSGNDLARVLNFKTRWEAADNTYKMGDNDATYEWKVGGLELVKGDEPIKLSDPPISRNSLVYIPVTAIGLLQDDMNYSVTEKELVIFPSAEMVTDPIDGPEAPNMGSDLDFADDPNDPFKGTETGKDNTRAGISLGDYSHNESMMAASRLENETDENALPVALQNIDIDALIQKGKSYLGVTYLFGAAPYPASSKFDCSTYSQYLYKRQGVTLKRTARAQANQGTAVSRSSLRKGDLLFFYVPGRFRTNKTVGHVGIYMGNSLMIHSSPEPKNGVQITDINKAYWKKTFLRAKRVAY
ncbi:peptidoglycan endopeptidase [Paenibacillus sp. LMG 31456]|uniref:Peptidoglycan endopeptidase n=1 Tax=Paenibacillus foliorum TaxID=2654974 RepID=A0A972GKA8_9BACL|nr:C40 family peptidase [Paenibacillus foliorum]NOU92292.1 peptidoglycan endopeptidase [Paenibacillus foliorum]